MQPWKVSVGLTAAAAGICAILLGGWFGYLKPFWSVILEDYRVPITWHLGLGPAGFRRCCLQLGSSYRTGRPG